MFTKLLIAVTFIVIIFGDEIDREAYIEKQTNEIRENGQYKWNFVSSNGIQAQENGIGGIVASGASQYYSPDGTPIRLIYIADENGFRAEGDHLPTSPPTPNYILRSIEFIRNHRQKVPLT